MSEGILDESLAVGVLQLSLADQVRHIDLDTDGLVPILNEAASALRDCRNYLRQLPGRLGPREVDLYRELVRLHLVWSAVEGRPDCATQTIIDLLEAPGKEEVHEAGTGHLFAADLLEEAAAVFRDLPGDLARALYDRVSAKKTRLVGNHANEHRVSCDYTGEGGVGCYERSPGAPRQEEAERYARNYGWFVSEERDLCPLHARALGLSTEENFSGYVPPGILSVIPDPVTRDAALLECLAMLSGIEGPPQEFVATIKGIYPWDLLVIAASELVMVFGSPEQALARATEINPELAAKFTLDRLTGFFTELQKLLPPETVLEGSLDLDEVLSMAEEAAGVLSAPAGFAGIPEVDAQGVMPVPPRHGHAEFLQIIGLAYQRQISREVLCSELEAGLSSEQRAEARFRVSRGYEPSADHAPYSGFALAWLSAT